jgi:hypothetical protein
MWMALCLRTKTEKEFEEDDGGRKLEKKDLERDMKAADGKGVRWRCFVEVLSSGLA